MKVLCGAMPQEVAITRHSDVADGWHASVCPFLVKNGGRLPPQFSMRVFGPLQHLEMLKICSGPVDLQSAAVAALSHKSN